MNINGQDIPASDIREIEYVPGADIAIVKRHSTCLEVLFKATRAQYDALAARLVIARMMEDT